MRKDLPPYLKWWHIAALCVHICSSIVLSRFKQPSQFPGEIGPYSYSYTCINNTNCSVSQSLAYEFVSSTPQQGVFANEVITALSHLIGFFVCYTNKRSNEIWRRWTEYAITAGILECSILYGYGVRDFFVFVLVFSLNAALQYTGGLNLDQIENDDEDNNLYSSQKPILLVQSFIFLFVQIWFTLTTAINFNATDLGSEVLSSSIFYAVFYASFGVLQTLSHTVEKFNKNYDSDVGFIVLSVTSKLCLSFHVVSIQKQIEQTLGDTSSGLADEVTTLGTAVNALYIVSAIVIGLYILWPRICKKNISYSAITQQ